jgi:hypothetical protein
MSKEEKTKKIGRHAMVLIRAIPRVDGPMSQCQWVKMSVRVFARRCIMTNELFADK